MKVYVSLLELKPLEGCQFDPKDVAGAFVRCYLPALNYHQAIKMLIAAIEKLNFELIEIEWCVDCEAVEWENPNNLDGEKYIMAAKQGNDVIFDDFNLWGDE